ncbi:MAG TPA: HAD family phosphatase [Thermoanaerobaculia bacterium]|jgi:beta-phosphoglucomutase|nr:HAD family phosphatase [Thermoanaerobaculia bacterium]
MDAVLFDMDGVLIDSYEPHLRSWRRLATEEGLPFDAAELAKGFGRTGREAIALYWPGRASEAARLDARKEELFRQEIAGCFPAAEGARELVTALADAGFALAVASSGPPENVDLAVDRLGLRSCFGAVVTGRDVPRGKPDPQIFLLAARRLGVPPARCAVIEDAPLGVEAAHRGGMKAVAVLSTGRRAEDFTAVTPERIVRSLRELSPRDFAELLADGSSRRHRNGGEP